jgi:pimeloyl-ACP methyl ester carboxylesterase
MKISQAQQIQSGERDRHLDLLADRWPLQPLDRWELSENTNELSRLIERDSGTDKLFPKRLREVMLRFPSAPIHGVQRLQEYHAKLPHSEVMHTFRVLRHSSRTERPTRIFLLYNGLNESDKMVLYYQLASQLVASDPDTVCILHPFPGHLTRYPWQEFGETPLDRYLWDGSHLFRQFLRHMTETQWLLSALASPGSLLPQTGAPLLRDKGQHALATKALACRIGESWNALLAESKRALSRARTKQNVDELSDDSPSEDTLLDVVQKLRSVMGLPDERSEDEKSPPIHVIGYSLGGFAAQSVFMTWPSIISSCATLLSGGALRALTPTEFAHREEWQTVLHSLRYELDDGMVDGRYAQGDDGIAGLQGGLFHYFQRAFYEVFQQEYRGSFQTRVQAFRKRMFFVVGGDDPIVSPHAVLESSPEGGMNILEIGGMGHFLSGSVKDEDEQLEREFWIPQIGKFISDCSVHAAIEHRREFEAANAAAGRAEAVRSCPSDAKTRMLTERERLALSPDGALSSDLFGRYLDDLLARPSRKEGGYLWIFRNEVPTIMLDPDSLRRRAHSLFHDERRIEAYCEEVSRRRMAWLGKLPATIVVLPWNAERILVHQDGDHGFASQSESAMGPLRNPLTAEERIARFRDTCKTATASNEEAILIFDGRDQATDTPGIGLPPPSLPDCWVYTSREFVEVADKEPVKVVIDALTSAVERVARTDNKVERGKRDRELESRLKSEELRIIAVSRARFNPRYRGKVLLNAKAVRTVLHHITWCLDHAAPYDTGLFDRNDVYPSTTVQETARPRLLSPLDDEFLQTAVDLGWTGRRGIVRERRQPTKAYSGEERRKLHDRRGATDPN